MAEIITLQFAETRLPRRLRNDGWWLESRVSVSRVIAFPKMPAAETTSAAKPNCKPTHLTLITSGK